MRIRSKLVLYTTAITAGLVIFLTWWATANQLAEISEIYAQRATTLANSLRIEVEENVYDLQVDRLRSALRRIRQDKDVLCTYVLDADAHILTDGTDDNLQRGSPLPEPLRQVLSARGGTLSVGNTLYAGRAVAATDGKALGYVIIGLSLELEQALIREAAANSLVLCGALIIVAIGVGIWLSGSFTRPILGLVGLARRIAAGDLTARTTVASQDELGELGTALNQMAEDLHRTQTELHAHRSQLEVLVAQRTRELSQMNEKLQQEIERRAQVEQDLRRQQETLEETVEQRTQVLYHQLVERTRVEKGLLASERKYQALFDQIADPIFVFDAQSYKFLDCNRAVERIYGYTREELRALTPVDLHPPEEEALVRANLDVRNVTEPNRYTHVTKDGRRLSVEILSDKIDYQGAAAWISIVRDITSRRQSEQALIRAERMAAVGTLAGGIAHEFNNIHAIIMGYLELMRGRSDLPADVAEILGILFEASERATDITRNLLTFCRRDTRAHRRMALSTIVRDTLKILMREFTSEGIQITNRLDDAVRVRVDPQQIGQVVMNLLINARHAMVDSATKAITLESGTRGERAFLRVSDTGCGIPDEQLTTVFTPFFTTKGEHAEGESGQTRIKGTGLGLSVCETIIKDHQGEIEVTSRIGAGATFTVWLPLAPDEETRYQRRESFEHAVAGARIFVLDDEEHIRSMLAQILAARGYEVTTSDDGNEALAQIQAGRVDLVIVDLQMPKMAGSEFLKRLQALPVAERPPALIMTGKLTDEQVERYKKLEVFALLPKPCRSEVLCERIHAALQSRAR